jgi:hypothetical protein
VALGVLAIYFGDAALELMRTCGAEVALWVAGASVLGVVAWWLVRRWRGSRAVEPA